MATGSGLLQVRYTFVGRSLGGDPDEVLQLARVMLGVRGADLLGFGVAGTHLHAVLELASRDGPRSVQALTRSLAARGGSRLAPAWFEPVRDRAHLRSLVRYLIRQPSHHAVGVADALWPGSMLQDLVGARRFGTFDPDRLFRRLPTLRPDELLSEVGLGALPRVRPEEIDGFAPAEVAVAAARAVALPDLRGRSREVLGARRAAVALLCRGGWPLAALERVFGVGVHALRRDARAEPDEQMIAVVGRQLALRRAVRELALTRLGRAKE